MFVLELLVLGGFVWGWLVFCVFCFVLFFALYVLKQNISCFMSSVSSYWCGSDLGLF